MGNKVGYDRIDGGMLMSGVLRRRRFLFTVLVGAFVFLVLPLGVIRRRNLVCFFSFLFSVQFVQSR